MDSWSLSAAVLNLLFLTFFLSRGGSFRALMIRAEADGTTSIYNKENSSLPPPLQENWCSVNHHHPNSETISSNSLNQNRSEKWKRYDKQTHYASFLHTAACLFWMVSLTVILRPFQSPVALAMSSPTFLGDWKQNMGSEGLVLKHIIYSSKCVKI